jgi:CheY-like chemotaxis protein
VFGVAAEALPQPIPASLSDLQQKSVLVVDDSSHTRHSLVGMLHANGLEARAVASGEEALTALAGRSQAGEPFDLVLMDWRLPGMNGIETSRRIKASRSLTKIPAILIISVFERSEVMSELGELELEGFLASPVAESQLIDTIGKVFGARPGGQTDAPQSTPGKAARLTGRHVLLVEDNDFNRDIAAEVLTELGISFTIAVNGREAVDMVAAQPFDLVLMDIQMPVMDGLTATKLIRADARFRSLPILAMTAHAMSGDRDRSLNAGMNDHITKTISFDELTMSLIQWMPVGPVNVAQMKSIIDDLLETTRIRTGRLTVRLESVSVPEVVHYAIQTLERAASAKSINISVHIGEGLGAACADKTRLRQLLVILLENAVKFTPIYGAICQKTFPRKVRGTAGPSASLGMTRKGQRSPRTGAQRRDLRFHFALRTTGCVI